MDELRETFLVCDKFEKLIFKQMVVDFKKKINWNNNYLLTVYLTIFNLFILSQFIYLKKIF